MRMGASDWSGARMGSLWVRVRGRGRGSRRLGDAAQETAFEAAKLGVAHSRT
jgi:hypothetical protein